MRNCFVPKCDNICKNNPRRMMFMAPKNAELFQQWKDVLPKKREFKRVDKVCERHFTREDIMTTFDHVINGELLQMERGRPRLNSTAVPSLNLEVSAFPREKPAARKATIAKGNSKKVTHKQERSNSSCAYEPVIESSTSIDKLRKEESVTLEPPLDTSHAREDQTRVEAVTVDEFESLYDDVFEVTLPSTLWGVHREPERQFIAFTLFDIAGMQNTKSVVLCNNGCLKIASNGKVVSEQVFGEEITPEFMSNILNDVEETDFVRINGGKTCEVLTDGSDDGMVYS